MKILVCFRAIPNWEKVLDEDWEVFSSGPDIKYAGSGLGCFDEAALELSLRMKNQAGEDAFLAAVTVGGVPAAALTETLYAAGFDEIIALKSANADFAPAHVAARLAEFAREKGFDLILAGRSSGMADTGLVPLLLAQSLGLPAIQDVTDISLTPGGVQVEQSDENGLWRRAYASPALVTVGNSPAVLRAISLRARLASRGRAVTVIPCGDFTADAPALLRPKSERALTMLSFADENELAKLLLDELSTPDAAQTASAAITPPEGVRAVCCDGGLSPERLSAALGESAPDLILLNDTPRCRALAVRLAAKTGASVQSGVQILRFENRGVYVKRRVCAANLDWEQFFTFPVILTTAQALPASAISPEAQGADIKKPSETVTETTPLWEERLAPPAEKGLASFDRVIVCGAGVGSRETCDAARLLAQRLGAGFALTRPAALGLWGGADEIIGISGSIIAPRTCLILGASGAGAFMAGLEGAGKICAVNTDPRALIFRAADFGALADAPAVIDAMLARCGKEG